MAKKKRSAIGFFEHVSKTDAMYVIITVLAVLIALGAMFFFPELREPICDESCRFEKVYNRCIERDRLSVIQCEAIALESVD